MLLGMIGFHVAATSVLKCHNLIQKVIIFVTDTLQIFLFAFFCLNA